MAVPLRRLEGKYQILEKFKEGGMGAIYRVRHRLLGDERVVKILRPQLEDEFWGRYQAGRGPTEFWCGLFHYKVRGRVRINNITRESKPGRRVYRSVAEITRVLNGTGIAIYTTPQGVMSDRECREQKIGGEMLATVW